VFLGAWRQGLRSSKQLPKQAGNVHWREEGQKGVGPATGLAAAILNNSNNNCSKHNTWQWWMEHKTGWIIKFPNASNSHYGLFGDGAIILLLFVRMGARLR
jgi:hypothetical protein